MFVAIIHYGILSLIALKLLINLTFSMKAFTIISRNEPDEPISLFPVELALIIVSICIAFFVDRPGWLWHGGKLAVVLLTAMFATYALFFATMWLTRIMFKR